MRNLKETKQDSPTDHVDGFNDLSASQRWILYVLNSQRDESNSLYLSRSSLKKAFGYKDQNTEPFLTADEQMQEDLAFLCRLGLVEWNTSRSLESGWFDSIVLCDKGVKLFAEQDT